MKRVGQLFAAEAKLRDAASEYAGAEHTNQTSMRRNNVRALLRAAAIEYADTVKKFRLDVEIIEESKP